jgi:hypothetical protein
MSLIRHDVKSCRLWIERLRRLKSDNMQNPRPARGLRECGRFDK